MHSAEHEQVARLAVRVGDGETIRLAVRLQFQGSALVGVMVPPAPRDADARDLAARRLVQHLAQRMAAQRVGITQLHREAELAADLAEQLVDLEASHGAMRGAA